MGFIADITKSLWGHERKTEKQPQKIINNPASAFEVAKKIRGNHKPAIFIYGVTARSGTYYLGSLLREHPDLCYCPRQWYESNFLEIVPDLQALQKTFEERSRIASPLEQQAFSSLFGAALIAYLYDGIQEHQQILMKAVKTKNLGALFQMFPHEKIILLLRDGRDVAESTCATWTETPFDEICLRWSTNASEILAFEEKGTHSKDSYLIVRYESICSNPLGETSRILKRFSLDPKLYPAEKAGQVPVIGTSELKKYGQIHWNPIPKPEGFNPIGRWKRWTADQKKIFKEIAGQTLIRCGYASDMNW